MQETQETRVQSLSWEDPLEDEMATHSSILAWRIPWTEELGGPHSMGLQRVRHDWARMHATTHTELTKITLPLSLVSPVYLLVTSPQCMPLFQTSCASLVDQMVKNLPAMQETQVWSRRSPGEGNGNPIQYSYLENSMDKGAWWDHKSWTWLSN